MTFGFNILGFSAEPEPQKDMLIMKVKYFRASGGNH
jgi:hypothetical protein